MAKASFYRGKVSQKLSAPYAQCQTEQNEHVMDTSAKRCADQNPKRPRQESELRSQHRSNQRPGSSNRRKMVSKNHPSIGRHIILIVILQDCGRGALFI